MREQIPNLRQDFKNLQKRYFEEVEQGVDSELKSLDKILAKKYRDSDKYGRYVKGRYYSTNERYQ